MVETKEGNLPCYMGIGEKGQVLGKYKKDLKEFTEISVLKINQKRKTLSTVQIYEPTVVSEEKDCDFFYKEFQKTNDKIKNQKSKKF